MLDNTSERGFASTRPKPAALHSIGSIPTETVPKVVEEYEDAIRRNSASFLQLASAALYSREQRTPDPGERARNEEYFARLMGPFAAVHGHITHSFYCEHATAAVALTDRGEICRVFPRPEEISIGVADILLECERLDVEADRVLRCTEDLKATKMVLYAVFTKLLSLLDGSTPPSDALLDLHRREAGYARDYYQRAAARRAKLDYLLGMLIGAALCAAVIAIAALGLSVFGLALKGRTLIGCLAAGAGAVGAVVSVMSRMTFDKLTLDYEAGHQILIRLGVFRPFVGMVFGVALWVLAESHFVMIGPNNPDHVPFFEILIAFLAGFSERWAQDMLGRAADQIGRSSAGRKLSRQGDRPK
jgi:hypothetical protein